MDIASLVKAIINSNTKGVLAITGGGTGAIPELLKRGGASAFLMSAHIPYAPEDWKEYTGVIPEKFTSESAARKLAMASYVKCRKLTNDNTNCIGLGASCALAKNGPERKDREHRIAIAYQSRHKTFSIVFNLPHLEREIEEQFAANLIIRVLGDACGVTEGNWIKENGMDDKIVGRSEVVAPYELMQLVHGERKVWYPKYLKPDVTHEVIFPGSFNPRHDGHKEIVEIAYDELKKPVLYEISVTNTDKPPIDYIDIMERAAQFDGNVVFTNAPLVLEKARLFTNATFLVGGDSWKRVRDTKYYGGSEARKTEVFEELVKLGAKFIVFPRVMGSVHIAFDPSENEYGLARGSMRAPIHLDCSSSKIRAEAAKATR